MTRPIPSGARSLWAIVAVTLASACTDARPSTAPILDETVQTQAARLPDPAAQPLTVYTQNVYLGGDTGPIFSLDLSNLPAVLQATHAFWAQVKASDVPTRAAAIVDELDTRRPHLVGLQEVFRFVVVDPRTGAVLEYLDLLAAIQAEILARRLPYEVVRVQENTSSALPLEVDFSVGQVSKALSFTDRVVALRRTDVTLTSSDQGTYAARFSLGPVVLKRGWIRLSAHHDGVPVHLVTTHLETQGLAPVQAGQLTELLGAVVPGLEGVTILAGDFNSDAQAGPGAPSWTPSYEALLGAGFVDAWTQSNPPRRDRGFTCCQDPDLRNGPSLLDERIDFVLVRTSNNPAASGRIPGSIDVEVVGEEQRDRTASGLWPADHAGLVAELRLPKGLNR
jgi:endonuclease/exonuclease/phosphatase family metal-dependent hydrolase